MADMKFSCSHCGQEIECDELWSGHEIQCPTCQGQLVVPPKPDAPPHATLASAKPNQPRLSIGLSRTERSAAPPPPPPQMATLQQQLNQAKLARKGNPMKWVYISVAVIALGVGGYFGYGYFTQWQAKRSEAAKQASDAAAQQAAAAAAPEPATPPPEKELPVIAPTWTLDLDKATIPTSKVNGVISGTNFLAETAMCTPQILRLFQGTSASPDAEILLYLHLNPGESITGHTWTVSQDMKDHSVPQVVKRWKTNPKYAPQSKAYSYGYAMKLELGDLKDGVLPGKIYLALPDTEQTVVAGMFKAMTTLANPNAAAAATPGMVPGAGVAPMPRGPAGPGNYERYGGRKR